MEMKNILMKPLFWSSFIAVPAVFAQASPPVPADPFADAMVLQRGMKVPVWGKADPGAKVAVAFAGQVQEAQTDAKGAWRVELAPLEASAENRVMTVSSGTDKVEIKDVLVGEVWICAGQSNMEFPAGRVPALAAKDARPADAGLRLRQMRKMPAASPQEKIQGTPWLAADPASTQRFSAVGFVFGRKLRQELKVPVGLIEASWGGTRIEAWTPAGAKPAVPSPADNAAHQKPAVLYNGMVHPWAGYAVRGALWYQGESNCIQKDGMAYADRMAALVSGWRKAFGSDLAFHFVQIAPFNYTTQKVPSDTLPTFWQAQVKAAREIPGTGMAVTGDVGNWKDIHPVDKVPVGERLARLALSRNYGVKFADDCGPVLKSAKAEGAGVRVAFDHAVSGLAASDDKPLSSFELAGADGVFFEASAVVKDGSVVVSSQKVAKPAQVRFAWRSGVGANLINGERLPAVAFSAKVE